MPAPSFALVAALFAAAAATPPPASVVHPGADPSSDDPAPGTVGSHNMHVELHEFIQPQYQWHDDADSGLDPVTGAPLETSRFVIRRARLSATATATAPRTRFYVQLDWSSGATIFA